MLGLAPTSPGQSGVQLSLYQSRLRQAQREAEEAQARVQTLERQTSTARQESAQATDKVRRLESQLPRRNQALNLQGQSTGRLLDVTA